MSPKSVGTQSLDGRKGITSLKGCALAVADVKACSAPGPRSAGVRAKDDGAEIVCLLWLMIETSKSVGITRGQTNPWNRHDEKGSINVGRANVCLLQSCS